MKILSNKTYNELIGVIREQEKTIKSLKTENAILNQAIVTQNIDFPNSAVKSTEINIKI